MDRWLSASGGGLGGGPNGNIEFDYQDTIKFVAVAGRSDLGVTAERAEELLTDNVAWGFDESIWELYDIFGQPASVMLTGDDLVVEGWYGVLGEEDLREKFDLLAGLG